MMIASAAMMSRIKAASIARRWLLLVFRPEVWFDAEFIHALYHNTIFFSQHHPFNNGCASVPRTNSGSLRCVLIIKAVELARRALPCVAARLTRRAKSDAP